MYSTFTAIVKMASALAINGILRSKQYMRFAKYFVDGKKKNFYSGYLDYSEWAIEWKRD